MQCAARKSRPRNDLLFVGLDVKRYSLNSFTSCTNHDGDYVVFRSPTVETTLSSSVFPPCSQCDNDAVMCDAGLCRSTSSYYTALIVLGRN